MIQEKIVEIERVIEVPVYKDKIIEIEKIVTVVEKQIEYVDKPVTVIEYKTIEVPVPVI